MEFLANFGQNLAMGFDEAVSAANLLYCFAGVFIGCLVGVLPGLGSLIAISLLLPITYYLPVSGAIIMLAGVYFGADYGGGTCSILLGVPGHAAAAIDVLDGYPMAKAGRGGVALFIKAIASFWGSLVGIFLLMLFAPLIANFALGFGPSEYFSLMLLGLIAASTVGQGSPVKSIAMMVIGLLLGVVGTDINSGAIRFGFDILELSDNLSLVAVAMGLFALTEVIKSANEEQVVPGGQSYSLRDQIPSREDWRRSLFPMLRGSGLGAFFGALPGTSGGMATFISYAMEKRISKTPERFGKGAIEGVAGPEACNNAGVGTAFIPTLTLGIPGDAIMALLLAALMIQGIQPGPQLLTDSPELFWGLIISFLIGSLFLVILNVPLIGIWVKILAIPYQYLFPAIVLFTCIGVYGSNNSVFDVYVLLAIGGAGYLMLVMGFEMIPVIIGFVLGPMVEENLRRTLILSGGELSVFVTRPITAAALSVCALLVASSIWSYWRKNRRESERTSQAVSG